MMEDKGILVNLVEMRQSYLRSVRKVVSMASANDLFHNVRVLVNNMDYYGKLKVSKDRLDIIPDDQEIDYIVFFDSHFRGGQPIIDDGKKIFRFQFNFKNERRPPLVICFKSRDVLNKFETAVSDFFGASTDFDPQEILIEEGEADELR